MNYLEEKTRDELINFLDDYGLKAKHLSKVLGWDYTTLLKFKGGKEIISEERQQQLLKFIRDYREAMKKIS